jgi:hypothetical protein
MARTAVARMFLVVVLAVAAHNLKPFSLPGVAGYMLEASTSFNFLLPQAAVAGLEGASLMVAALGTNTRTMVNHLPEASCPVQNADEGIMAFRSVVLPEGQIKVTGPKRARPSFVSAIARRAKGPRPEAIVLPQVEIADLVALRLPSREVAWMPVRNEVMNRMATRRVTLPPVPKRVVVRPASLIQPKMKECESEKIKEMRIAVDLVRERKTDEKRRKMAAEHKTQHETMTVEESEATQSEGEINENDSLFTVILKCS